MAPFEEKKVFGNLVFVQFYWLDQRQLFKQIQIYLRIFSFSNLLRKTNFLSISVLLSEIVTFLTKKRFFSEFPKKCFKTTEKHNLVVCGSFWGEKHFLFIFVQFYCFELKGLCTTNPNFHRDLLLFKLVEKNKLSEYYWASFWNILFWLKSEVFSVLVQKCVKTTGKHKLAVCGSFCGEKMVFVNICSVFLLCTKRLVYN